MFNLSKKRINKQAAEKGIMELQETDTGFYDAMENVEENPEVKQPKLSRPPQGYRTKARHNLLQEYMPDSGLLDAKKNMEVNILEMISQRRDLSWSINDAKKSQNRTPEGTKRWENYEDRIEALQYREQALSVDFKNKQNDFTSLSSDIFNSLSPNELFMVQGEYKDREAKCLNKIEQLTNVKNNFLAEYGENLVLGKQYSSDKLEASQEEMESFFAEFPEIAEKYRTIVSEINDLRAQSQPLKRKIEYKDRVLELGKEVKKRKNEYRKIVRQINAYKYRNENKIRQKYSGITAIMGSQENLLHFIQWDLSVIENLLQNTTEVDESQDFVNQIENFQEEEMNTEREKEMSMATFNLSKHRINKNG